MGLSRVLTAITNLLVMIASAGVFGIGLWLKRRTNGVECFEVLQRPLLVIGAVIFVVALLGFVGACCGVPVLLWLYLCVVFLAMLALIAFTVFSFIVTNPAAGEKVSGQGFLHYRLDGFSSWLQRQVDEPSRWNTIRSCLYQADTCPAMAKEYNNEASLFAAELSPIQAGCCLPPRDCGFTFVNATSFTIPASGPANTTDTDCTNYQNNGQDLCYGCATCKAGVLQNVRSEWRLISYINFGIVGFMFVVYVIGCCAYRSAKNDMALSFTKLI